MVDDSKCSITFFFVPTFRRTPIRSRPRRLGCTWELPSVPLSPIQALLRGPCQQTPPPSVVHHPSGWPTLSSVRLSDGSLLARCSSWFHTASFTCGRSSRHCYWRRSRLARSLAAGAFDGGRIVGSQQLENPAGQPQSWKPATRNYTSVEKSCTECSQAILQEDTNTNNSKRLATQTTLSYNVQIQIFIFLEGGNSQCLLLTHIPPMCVGPHSKYPIQKERKRVTIRAHVRTPGAPEGWRGCNPATPHQPATRGRRDSSPSSPNNHQAQSHAHVAI